MGISVGIGGVGVRFEVGFEDGVTCGVAVVVWADTCSGSAIIKLEAAMATIRSNEKHLPSTVHA